MNNYFAIGSELSEFKLFFLWYGYLSFLLLLPQAIVFFITLFIDWDALLVQEYDDAIKDCHSTLQLNPYHFGALSGMCLSLFIVSSHEDDFWKLLIEGEYAG